MAASAEAEDEWEEMAAAEAEAAEKAAAKAAAAEIEAEKKAAAEKAAAMALLRKAVREAPATDRGVTLADAFKIQFKGSSLWREEYEEMARELEALEALYQPIAQRVQQVWAASTSMPSPTHVSPTTRSAHTARAARRSTPADCAAGAPSDR